MGDSFVDGDAGSQRKKQEGYYKAPEIQFPAIPQRVRLIGRKARSIVAVKQQRFIAGVDERMSAFAEHRRAAGKQSCRQLYNGHHEVAEDGCIDHFLRS